MTKSELVHKIESFIPKSCVLFYRKQKRHFYWQWQQGVYRRAVHKLQHSNKPLNVIFLVQNLTEWKCDSVYQLMAKDPVFNPTIFLCPLIKDTKEEGDKITQRAFDKFTNRGYHVIKGYDEINKRCINLQTLSPDIVFYTSLWTGYTHKKYDSYSLRQYLKCYVNYGFCSIANEWGYASAFHGLMWHNFSECEDLKRLALQAQPQEMQNLIVTGYPLYDEYVSAPEDDSMWKSPDKTLKRIIWAPHHTIEGHDGLLKFSTFLENAEVMLELAEYYKDKIQFVFKPHPLLKTVLYNHPLWGKVKTDDYYSRWANGENTALVDGTYMSLFKTSDAMIHDCGSFIVEYLYTRKPVMYLAKYNREGQSNIVGKKALSCHYLGMNEEDIKHFIEDVILNEKDTYKEKRVQFHSSILLPPNNKSVAENIIDAIKTELHYD